MPAYRFDVVPIAAPRMTHADRWKRRSCVVRYFEYRDQVRDQAQVMGFTLPSEFSLWFQLPVPKSWSQRKKRMMFGEPALVRPDVDNLAKGFLDCFGEDKHIWSIQLTKTWHDRGGIVVTTSDAFCWEPHFEYKDGKDYKGSDYAKRSEAQFEQAKEKHRLLANLIARQEAEQWDHEEAWREHQAPHADRWRPADERRGTWRPDFED